MERGESLASAVEREMLEETGLAVRCGPFLGWAERLGPGYHFVILDFTVSLADDGAAPWPEAMPPMWRGSRWRRSLRLPLVDGVEEFLRSHGVID